jgi:hypothetical protein
VKKSVPNDFPGRMEKDSSNPSKESQIYGVKLKIILSLACRKNI